MVQTDRAQTLFDRWSMSYDHSGLQRLTYRPVHDAVLARVAGTTPTTVIDLGCGTGQLTRRLARRFPEASVVGVDLSEGMLSVATGWSDEIGAAAFVRADATDLPFGPSSTDLVVCTDSFHWYPDQMRVAEELVDVLRPGGRLLIASIATLTVAGDQLVRMVTRTRGPAISALPPRQLRTLLQRAGMEVTHQHRVPRLGPFTWPVLTDARRR